MFYSRHSTHPTSWGGFYALLTLFSLKHILIPLYSVQKTGFLFQGENGNKVKKRFSYLTTKFIASKRKRVHLTNIWDPTLMLRLLFLKIKYIIMCLWCIFERCGLWYTHGSEDNSVELVLSYQLWVTGIKLRSSSSSHTKPYLQVRLWSLLVPPVLYTHQLPPFYFI